MPLRTGNACPSPGMQMNGLAINRIRSSHAMGALLALLLVMLTGNEALAYSISGESSEATSSHSLTTGYPDPALLFHAQGGGIAFYPQIKTSREGLGQGRSLLRLAQNDSGEPLKNGEEPSPSAIPEGAIISPSGRILLDPSREPVAPHPHPTLGDYGLDLFLAAAATFAWKRAVNVTAARRIIVETYSNFSDNLQETPAIDDGNWWGTNYVLHPLLGMFYYNYFRSRGHSRFMSAMGSFLESTIHEYLIEASFEPASGIDIVLTPGLGVPLGLLTDEVSVRWIRSDSRTKRFFGYVINPMLTMPWSRWRRDISYDPRTDRFSFRLEFIY